MMNCKKVLIVFGTRPEAIKFAPIISEFMKHKSIEVRVCVTAQHREMLDQVLELFDISVHYDLDLMQKNQELTDVNIQILDKMRHILREFCPDWVLVQGDTTTTFAAGLAAFYEKIAVGHLEAGLRTNNIYSPWPEEVNRNLVSRIAALHFAPTAVAAENLRRENISSSNIVVTGNTVIDALLMTHKRIKDDALLAAKLRSQFDYLSDDKRRILVTGHRRESFGDGFLQICRGLKQLAQKNDVEIVYPVHLNPNVRKPVNEILGGCPSVHLIEPQEYLPFVYLMDSAYLILTDSGGVQEEAPSLGKPVLVMRDTTERTEAIDAGAAKLVGANMANIVTEVERLLDDKELYNAMSRVQNPFGDGFAAKKTIEGILRYE